MNVDPPNALLDAYLKAENEADADLELGRILHEYAKPLVCRIASSAMRGHAQSHDVEDVVADTLAHLLRRFRGMKQDPAAHGILDLRGYVVTAAYNGCHERLRRKYPGRNRLRNHLRYFLRHHPEFALWHGADSRMLCGLRTSMGQPMAASDWADRWSHPARSDPAAVNRVQIHALVAVFFREAPGPVPLDALVAALGRSIQLNREPMEVPLEGEDADGAAAVDCQLEQRQSLRQLWKDIVQLPPRQRAALLLNLRDAHGQEIISLLPHTRTVTIADIAAAVDMPLADFARLWGDLPLADSRIGELLGLSPPQVIKLRRLARERLRRIKSRRETATLAGRGKAAPQPPTSGDGLPVRSKLGVTTP